MYFWENDKVYLRMIEEEDSEKLYTHLMDTDSRVQPEHGMALPATVRTSEEMAEYAKECTNCGEELWFAIVNHDHEMVGYAVIDWMNERMGNAQLHIQIFREHKRHRYAANAAGILLRYLLHERRFEKVGCCVLEHNEEGNEFVRSIGMALDGFRSEMFYIHGRYVGEYYYSMLREEYDKGAKRRDNFTIPDSNLGQLPDGIVKSGRLVTLPANPGDERAYFWKYDGIELRDMTKEEYLMNRAIVYDTEACVFYDSDVKLPGCGSEELTDYENAHLNFGGEDNRIEFSIWNDEDEYVGNINLCGIDKKNGKFSYSVYILKEHRGKGYATKALRLILWYGFMELRMHKMICGANDGNDGSAVVMRKVGCHVEGVLRNNEYYHGKYTDMVLFGVNKSEFMLFHGMDGK